MSEIFVTLEEAAVFEGVVYETMKKRIQRNPGGFRVKSQPREGGGKDQVMVAVSSLTPKAKRAHKAAQKIDGGDAIIEQRVNTTPWYVDVDLNWYIETHKKQYYEAVELAKQVQQFVEHDEAERTAYADETALKLGVSQRTLYRYAEGLLEANAWALKMEKEEGKNYEYFRPLSLCRKPRDSHTFPSVTDEHRALIENIWFDERFARNLGTVEMLYTKFTSVASEREWPSCPSYSTVARYVSYLMNDLRGESARFYAANGSREWKNQRMIKGKRNVSALQVMEFVQGDEHTFDCWVQVTHSNGKIAAVRPKLVAWLDTRSRCILGDVMCIDANAQTLKESLVKMLYSTPGGVPKHLHIDNGKDYTAETNLGQSRKVRACKELEFDSETRGFYRSIGIEEWSRSLPYQPWGKGQIERFFGTVCSLFTKWMDSYVGTLTGSKTSAKRKKDVKQMLERGELLTMEEFFDLWTRWKNEVYHKREHSGLKKDREKWITPIELFQHGQRYEKAAPPREYAAMLLMKADTALVRNQGIMKFGTLYTDYELAKYVGEKVGIKWDIDDVTKLYVYTRDGRKICEAVSAELLMIAPKMSQEALEKHLRNQKRQRKEVRETLEEFRRPYELRLEEGNGKARAVGALDLTIRSERSQTPKVITLPNDKEFRGEAEAKRKATAKAGGDSEFITAKAEAALSKLRGIG